MRRAIHSLVGSFHQAAIFDRRTRVLAQATAARFPEGALVLDVGCGDGTIASLWTRLRPDIRVVGIDTMVRPETKITVGTFNGRHIPHESKSVDVVTFVDVLHHTTEPELLLMDASRVAKRCVIVKDHIAESMLDHATLRFMDWVGNAHHGVALPFNYLSWSRWQKAFDQAGLELHDTRGSLPLYGFPASLIFGRNLHFIAELSIR
jgi:SAM-dependent methyltransferase